MSKRVDGDGETTYEYSVEGRLVAVKAGGRTLMAATYDGDGNRIMQASPYHEDVPGTEGSALDGGAGDEGDASEGLSLWSIGLFWYGFAAGGAAALAAANPAAMVGAVEAACALVEATWPEGALDPDAADYALSHLGIPALDLAAMTGSYGASEAEPASTAELLDVVTYTNSSVVGDVAQVAFSHSTRSGESDEVYGLERLSKGGTSYAYDGRGSVAPSASRRREAHWASCPPTASTARRPTRKQGFSTCVPATTTPNPAASACRTATWASLLTRSRSTATSIACPTR